MKPEVKSKIKFAAVAIALVVLPFILNMCSNA